MLETILFCVIVLLLFYELTCDLKKKMVRNGMDFITYDMNKLCD